MWICEKCGSDPQLEDLERRVTALEDPAEPSLREDLRKLIAMIRESRPDTFEISCLEVEARHQLHREIECRCKGCDLLLWTGIQTYGSQLHPPLMTHYKGKLLCGACIRKEQDD